MINIAIVDDDISMYSELNLFCEQFKKENNVELFVQCFDNAFDFIEINKKFDVVFMDIMMPMYDGMTACKKLRKENQDIDIIFVTNSVQFAVEGYNVDALGYILKPVRYSQFSSSLKKSIRKYNESQTLKGSMLVKTLEGEQLIKYIDIEYIEISEHLLSIHTIDGGKRAWLALKDVLNLVPSNQFCRANYSMITNFNYVSSVVKDHVILKNGVKIKLSRSYKKDFLDNFYLWLGK